MEELSRRASEFEGFRSAGFELQEVIEQLRSYEESIHAEDLGNPHKIHLLKNLVTTVNSYMVDHDMVDQEVQVGQDSFLPVKDDEEEGKYYLCHPEESIHGVYKGVYLLSDVRLPDSEGEPTEADIRYKLPQIVHRILLYESRTESSFIERSESRYAMLLLESDDIDIMKAPSRQQANKGWIWSVIRSALDEDSGQIQDIRQLHNVFDRIVHAKSKFPVEKNIDITLDCLNSLLPFIEQRIRVGASAAIIHDGEDNEIRYLANNNMQLEGTLLGFSDMPNFYIDATGEELEPIPILDSRPLLGMFLDVSTDPSENSVLAKIPLLHCSGELVVLD